MGSLELLTIFNAQNVNNIKKGLYNMLLNDAVSISDVIKRPIRTDVGLQQFDGTEYELVM
jgi:hypothetical protein